MPATSISAGRGNRIVVRRSSYVGLICSDKYKLYRILANLLSNADKFTHHGAIILNVKVCHGNLYLWVKKTPASGLTSIIWNDYIRRSNQGWKGNATGIGAGADHYQKLRHDDERRHQGQIRRRVGSSFLIRVPVKLIKE